MGDADGVVDVRSTLGVFSLLILVLHGGKVGCGQKEAQLITGCKGHLSEIWLTCSFHSILEVYSDLLSNAERNR